MSKASPHTHTRLTRAICGGTLYRNGQWFTPRSSTPRLQVPMSFGLYPRLVPSLFTSQHDKCLLIRPELNQKITSYSPPTDNKYSKWPVRAGIGWRWIAHHWVVSVGNRRCHQQFVCVKRLVGERERERKTRLALLVSGRQTDRHPSTLAQLSLSSLV